MQRGSGIFNTIVVGGLLAGSFMAFRFLPKEAQEKEKEVHFSEAEHDLEAPTHSLPAPKSGAEDYDGSLGFVREEPEGVSLRSHGSMNYVAEGRAPSSKRRGSMGYLGREAMVLGAASSETEKEVENRRAVSRHRRNKFGGYNMRFSGTTGLAQRSVKIVRTKKGWAALGQTVKRKLPHIDFKDNMALVVFGGAQKNGSIAQVLGAEPKNGRLVIRYEVLRPLGRTRETIYPYQIVIVPATNLRPLWQRIH